jgi:hypothetical protein
MITYSHESGNNITIKYASIIFNGETLVTNSMF